MYNRTCRHSVTSRILVASQAVLSCGHGCIKEAGEVEVGGRRALQRRAEAVHRRPLQRAERVRVHALAGLDLHTLRRGGLQRAPTA
jgi:hypothetical protein